MLHLLAYDIADDKRRAKVAKILEGYGFRSEFSVFEADLTPAELVFLKADLLKHLDEETDKLFIYPICARCRKAIIRLVGKPPPIDDNTFIIG
ncbi:MAG: CRISPR-associated endonuclease Cas2 [Candidatus Coatesbacteria bacterium]|nr:CRISPR-associated endonuclease Cas2 [Candidatus Coatesbacteria bacterium]